MCYVVGKNVPFPPIKGLKNAPEGLGELVIHANGQWNWITERCNQMFIYFILPDQPYEVQYMYLGETLESLGLEDLEEQKGG